MGECWWRMGREEANRRQTKIVCKRLSLRFITLKYEKNIRKVWFIRL